MIIEFYYRNSGEKVEEEIQPYLLCGRYGNVYQNKFNASGAYLVTRMDIVCKEKHEIHTFTERE